MRLATGHFVGGEPADGHAVGEGVGDVVVDVLEGFALGVVLGDDPFACVAVGDVVGLAEGVELFFAADAEVG